MANKIVCIAGMHRSGTSFLARSLGTSGLTLPDPHTKPHAFNAHGHWENTTLSKLGRKLFGPGDKWYSPVIIDTAKRILSSMEETIKAIDDAQAQPWGWKDPRLTITYQYWRRVFPEKSPSALVISIRRPMEVALSLEARDSIPICDGLRLWERYNDWALWHLDRFPEETFLFNFNALNLDEEFRSLQKFIGLAQTDNHAVRYDSELHHHKIGEHPQNHTYNTILSRWEEQKTSRERSAGVSTVLPPASTKPSPYGPLKEHRTKPRLKLLVYLLPPEHSEDAPDKLVTLTEGFLQQIIENISPVTDFRVLISHRTEHHRQYQDLASRYQPFARLVEGGSSVLEDEQRLQTLNRIMGHQYQSDVQIFARANQWIVWRFFDILLSARSRQTQSQTISIEDVIINIWGTDQSHGAVAIDPNPTNAQRTSWERLLKNGEPATDGRATEVSLTCNTSATDEKHPDIPAIKTMTEATRAAFSHALDDPNLNPRHTIGHGSRFHGDAWVNYHLYKHFGRPSFYQPGYLKTLASLAAEIGLHEEGRAYLEVAARIQKRKITLEGSHRGELDQQAPIHF